MVKKVGAVFGLAVVFSSIVCAQNDYKLVYNVEMSENASS